MPEVVELRPRDVDTSFASAWDALPAARGAQADIYDSHAWFAAWLSAAPEGTADRVRIAAVMDGGRPVAMLPLLQSRGSRRAAIIGMSNRTRARPIIGTELPSQEVLGLLAEAVARSGVREVDLHRAPSHDPATTCFVAALRSAGYRVMQHERSCDNLAAANYGWADYAREHKGFANYAKRFTNKIESLWRLDVDTYGELPEWPVADGFDIYRSLHGRSWKGSPGSSGPSLRADLLNRAEVNGWARVYVLRIDGVAAAAHLWFRLGGVATWLSTVYDQRLAVLSPGTVIMWQAQSRIFADDPPVLVDLLPGANPQKDRLTTSTPPLLVTEAVRPSVWFGVSAPVRRHARRVEAAVAARLRARRRQHGAESRQDPGVLTTTAIPGQRRGIARRLDLSPAHRRFLATATGHAAPEKMAAGWAAEDEWWMIGESPSALFRIGNGQDGTTGQELIRLDSGIDLTAAAAELAAELGREIAFRETPVFDAALPWPRAWLPAQAGGGR